MSECPKLVQSEYKRCHDNVAKDIHWDICKQLGMECRDKGNNHNPEPVTENEDRKILWGLTIQTDKRLPHNRPGIVVIAKAKKKCHIVDVACPGDSRIVWMEEEKIGKYRDLAIEIKALWHLKKVLIVPFVIGALGSITDRLEGYLANTHVGLKPVTMQKTVLLGSARILQRVLES